MARPLRIEGEGFWYHVMARGDDGRVIFSDKAEFQNFLKRVEVLAELFSVELHAYVLMRTHFHMFVCTRAGALSRFMQRLLTGYCVWYNRRHERTGHVFQGRYKALLVERNAYGAEVSRYIHLNPARATSSHDLTELRRVARTYSWSSYRAYLGVAPIPPFLQVAETLERFGGVSVAGKKAYAQFVEEGLLHDLPDLADNVRAQSVLGTERFIERLRCVVTTHGGRDKCAHTLRQQLTNVPFEKIIGIVSALYHVNGTELCQAKRSRSEARRMLLWAAVKFCSGYGSLHQVGVLAGGITGTAVSKAARLVQVESAVNVRLRKRMEEIEARLAGNADTR